MKPETKTCQNCKNNFTIEPEDFLFYERVKVPAPTWCPECRMIRRMTFRNERHLFRTKDTLTGKEIFSGIPPQAPVKVYDHDYWWSDSWDPMDYGKEYDFSRPFFEQLLELMSSVPFPSRNITNLVNSEYSDDAGDLKNCYLVFNSGRAENSAYVLNSAVLKDSFDMTEVANSELCYDSLSIGDSYQVFFSLDCEKSHNLWFCKDCSGCSNCLECVNLRNKQYHIFNKPYGKEEYFKKIEELKLGSYSKLQKVREEAETFWKKFPVKYIHGSKNTDCSGDYIHNSKNVQYSFGITEGENLKYCQEVYRQPGFFGGGKDSYDHYNWGYGTELMYEVVGSGKACQNVRFCLNCWPAVRDIEYCIRCASSSNLFGCVGLRHKSHCILNKQYSQQEYEALRGKIIKQMSEMPYRDKFGREYVYGEFFPQQFSQYAYNETPAQDYFPLSKETAEKKGYVWRGIERKEYQATVKAADLPDNIEDAEQSLLKEIIACSSCKRAYRIIASEFEFLKKFAIPFPRLCPNCRYLYRFSWRNRPRYYQRSCMCAGQKSEKEIYDNQVSHFHGPDHCPNEFITSYASDRPEIVYCEQCYNSEVV